MTEEKLGRIYRQDREILAEACGDCHFCDPEGETDTGSENGSDSMRTSTCLVSLMAFPLYLTWNLGLLELDTPLLPSHYGLGAAYWEAYGSPRKAYLTEELCLWFMRYSCYEHPSCFKGTGKHWSLHHELERDSEKSCKSNGVPSTMPEGLDTLHSITYSYNVIRTVFSGKPRALETNRRGIDDIWDFVCISDGGLCFYLDSLCPAQFSPRSAPISSPKSPFILRIVPGTIVSANGRILDVIRDDIIHNCYAEISRDDNLRPLFAAPHLNFDQYIERVRYRNNEIRDSLRDVIPKQLRFSDIQQVQNILFSHFSQ